MVCDAKHPHEHPGMNGGSAYVELMKKVYAEVKAAKPTAVIISNAGSPSATDRLASGKTSLWDVADYVLWESYGYSSLPGDEHDRWPQTIKESYRVAGGPHAAKVLALAYPRSYPEALFSFAVARAFGFEYTANLGESQRAVADASGGHFGIFLPQLPNLTGKPVDAVPNASDPVLKRSYSDGTVVANTGTAPYSFKLPHSGTLYTSQGTAKVLAGKSVTVPAAQAVVLVY